MDSKQLSLQDLGYAVEHAWDEKVKQAAIALSLVRLKQAVKEPVPSAGFVHVVSGGKSYSERRQSALTLIQGMIFGFAFAVVMLLVISSTSDLFRPHPNAKSISELGALPTQVIVLIVGIGLAAFVGWGFGRILDGVTERLNKQIEEHRLGQEGEDNVVQLVVQALDGNWHLFRNVSLPGRNKADLDLVLVGPPGVWALEVKNFRGEYRNIGENWEYRHGKNWRAASKNPSRQAFNGAVRLGNFLKADNVKAFVNPAIVWANEKSPLFVENPTVSIWTCNRLPDELGNIWQGEKLPKAEQDKIVEKLTKLCEQQKKESFSN